MTTARIDWFAHIVATLVIAIAEGGVMFFVASLLGIHPSLGAIAIAYGGGYFCGRVLK